MSDLTRALGIGRQSLYDTFGDKRALFMECLEHYCAEVDAGVDAVLEAEGLVLANLRRLLEIAAEQAHTSDFRGCLLGNTLAELGSADPGLDALLLRKLERWFRRFERVFTRAQDNGELVSSADVTVLARALTAYLQGAALANRVWREPSAIAQTLQGAWLLVEMYAPGRGQS